eukprot:655531-Pelagomonas_calceolata.AAC.28
MLRCKCVAACETLQAWARAHPPLIKKQLTNMQAALPLPASRYNQGRQRGRLGVAPYISFTTAKIFWRTRQVPNPLLSRMKFMYPTSVHAYH